jgi:hypothetical protein
MVAAEEAMVWTAALETGVGPETGVGRPRRTISGSGHSKARDAMPGGGEVESARGVGVVCRQSWGP